MTYQCSSFTSTASTKHPVSPSMPSFRAPQWAPSSSPLKNYSMRSPTIAGLTARTSSFRTPFARLLRKMLCSNSRKESRPLTQKFTLLAPSKLGFVLLTARAKPIYRHGNSKNRAVPIPHRRIICGDLRLPKTGIQRNQLYPARNCPTCLEIQEVPFARTISELVRPPWLPPTGKGQQCPRES